MVEDPIPAISQLLEQYDAIEVKRPHIQFTPKGIFVEWNSFNVLGVDTPNITYRDSDDFVRGVRSHLEHCAEASLNKLATTDQLLKTLKKILGLNE